MPAPLWRGRRELERVYARMSNAERAQLLRQRPECELCQRRPSAAVDHAAATGKQSATTAVSGSGLGLRWS
ncbi:hypothetical protein [Streptomyces sp. CAU 1734]|uniref:hypothetical protein n=1 Tax=Streptomyces sp. CAU 1734 TaxID=3140360 RepID=UPI0032607934